MIDRVEGHLIRLENKLTNSHIVKTIVTILNSSKRFRMTVTTNERGQQNIFAKEPQVKVLEVTVTHNEKAEQLKVASQCSALLLLSVPMPHRTTHSGIW